MSLPRLLLLVEDGSLGIEPVPELKKLRINHRHRESIKLHTDSELTIEGVCGDCLKLQADIAPGRTTECGVKVRRSPDGEEETAIVCQPAAGALKIYLTKSTLDDAVT